MDYSLNLGSSTIKMPGIPRSLKLPAPNRDNHVPACPRYPVAKLLDNIPAKYIEALEQNQLLPSCCRHPENHDIEALYSCEEWRDNVNGDNPNGAPDIYVFHCTCGRKHTRFCVGQGDERPWWEVR